MRRRRWDVGLKEEEGDEGVVKVVKVVKVWKL